MLSKLFAITQFKNIWLIVPLLLGVLYVPQALWGLHIFGDNAAAKLILIIMLGLLVYCGTYLALQKVGPVSLLVMRASRSMGFDSAHFVKFVAIFYFLLIGYVLLTAEKIALVEALRDSSVDEIAFAREALFKTRLGWERVLPYLNAVFSSALMPFAVALAYLSRMTYRHWLLLFFCLSLMLSLEKALILKALLPVIAIGFQSRFSRKRAFTLVLILVGIVGALFFFGKMGRIDYEGQAKESLAKLEKQLIDLPGIRQKNFEDIDNSIKVNQNSIGVFEKQLIDLPGIRQKNFEDIDNSIKVTKNSIGIFDKQLIDLPDIKKKNLGNTDDSIKKNNAVALQEQHEKNTRYYINYEEQIRDALRQAHLSILFLQGQRVKNTEYFINYAIEVKAAINSGKVAYETHHKYNIFGAGQMGFAFNRLFWIPYVTAYDWLRYFDEKLHNQFLGGSSSFLVSKILGVQQFPIEREVFKYQFGAGGPQTGSANALFLVDAFVNFGWLGVIAYAFLLAAIIFLIQVINNPATIACLYFFLVQAVGGGLLGVLVGNGLLLLIFISVFIRPNSVQRMSGADGV